MFWTRVRLPSSPPSLTADLHWLTAQFDIIKNICYNIYREVRKVKKKTVKQMFKKFPEELEAYMAFKRKGSRVEAKKGKGSYRRHKKHREKED